MVVSHTTNASDDAITAVSVTRWSQPAWAPPSPPNPISRKPTKASGMAARNPTSASDVVGTASWRSASFQVHTTWPASQAPHDAEMNAQPRWRVRTAFQAVAATASAAMTTSLRSVTAVTARPSLPKMTGQMAKAVRKTAAAMTAARNARRPSP